MAAGQQVGELPVGEGRVKWTGSPSEDGLGGLFTRGLRWTANHLYIGEVVGQIPQGQQNVRRGAPQFSRRWAVATRTLRPAKLRERRMGSRNW